MAVSLRKGAARAALALALAAASVGIAGADPVTTPSTIATPPVVTEVGGKTLAQWIRDLDRGDPSDREEAVRAITLFGPAASEAVPELVKRLHDSDASPRCKAVIALGFIKINDKDRPHVVEALGAALADDSQAMVRYAAAVSLAELGADSKGALGGILHGVQDPSSWEIRRVAIMALATAGQTPNGPNPRATYALLGALLDHAAQVRLSAVTALGEMGRPADPTLRLRVVAAIKGMNNDRDKTVGIWAHLSMMALDKLDDADMAFLENCTRTGEPVRVRVNAVRALGVIGVKSKKAVPLLVDLLSDEDADVQGIACQALGYLGKDAPPEAEKRLTELSQGKDVKEPIKKAAQAALDAIKNARK